LIFEKAINIKQMEADMQNLMQDLVELLELLGIF
jgi:hypothetical protein